MQPWTLDLICENRPRHVVTESTTEMSVVGTDPVSNLTVGFDGANRLILVGPQHDTYEAFETSFARLDVNLSFRTQDSPEQFGPYFRLTFFVGDDEQLSCASAIVLGLNDMARTENEALPLESIQELVFLGFSDLPLEIETGLFGELIAILASGDVPKSVMAWHSNSSEIFDFETDGNYFEIKTTLGGRRQHWFSESQLRKVKPAQLSFISILTTLTNSGSTCKDLAAEISADLRVPEIDYFEKSLSKYPLEKMIRQFDRVIALDSLELFKAPVFEGQNVRPLSAIDAKYLLDLDLSCTRQVASTQGWLTTE